jgi:hypothetical protein
MTAAARSRLGARALAAALLCAAPGLAVAQLDEPDAPAPPPAPKPAAPADDFPPQYEWPVVPHDRGWSVLFEVALGSGFESVAEPVPDYEWTAGDGGSLLAAGFGLLVRVGEVAAGPFLHATAGEYGNLWVGAAGGWTPAPAPWARLLLLGELGGHRVDVESAFAGLPTASAWLPFVGVRAGAFAFVETPDRLLLGAQRVGIGLEAGVRADLATTTLTQAVPPEYPAAAPTRVGVVTGVVMLAFLLEW